MLEHMLLIDWNTIFFQHIENPLKLCEILLKCESSIVLVEYLLYVFSRNLLPL